MTKKLILLVVSCFTLAACSPYGYYNNGYGTQPTYNSYSQNMNSQAQANTFESGFSDRMFNDASAQGYSYGHSNTLHSSLDTQAQNYNSPMSGFSNQPLEQKPTYYNTGNASMVAGPQSIVGVGQTMEQMGTSTPTYQMQQASGAYANNNSKLLMPVAWRMAHPSIGKGLELTSQAERFELNRVVGSVSTKKPQEVKIAGKDITVISLADASAANAQGFLCKDVYLVMAERSKVNKMWGSFCRHPNWNEWVLTKW